MHFVNISDMKTLSAQLEPGLTCHHMKDKSNVATEITSRMPLSCGICDSNLRHVNTEQSVLLIIYQKAFILTAVITTRLKAQVCKEKMLPQLKIQYFLAGAVFQLTPNLQEFY